MKNLRLAVLAAALGLLGIAWAMAQEEENAPAADPGFVPSETIRADQGVAFPVDI